MLVYSYKPLLVVTSGRNNVPTRESTNYLLNGRMGDRFELQQLSVMDRERERKRLGAGQTEAVVIGRVWEVKHNSEVMCPDQHSATDPHILSQL